MAEPNHLKLRTTIMVASLIALPLAAVVGFKWPHFSAAEPTSTFPASKLAERKPLAQPAPAWGAVTKTSATSPGIQTEANVVQLAGGGGSNNPGYPVLQAGNNDVRAADGLAAATNPTVLPVSHVSEIRPLPQPGEEPAAPAVASTGDPFLQIQQRLRALGAIHYALETWGPHGEAYRFQCRMSAGHDPNYSRHFEATDVDPLRVMQTVLGDVEAWKSGRLP